MPRVKRSVHAKKSRKKILKEAKGFRGARGRLLRIATEAVERAFCFAYTGRKLRKRDFRSLWVTRINSAVRPYGISYAHFMGRLKAAGIALDRKSLADIAIHDPEGFEQIVKHIEA